MTLSLLGLCAAAGCFPFIAHTPQVDRGTHMTLAAAIAVGAMERDDDSLRRSAIGSPVGVVRGSYGFRSAQNVDGPGLELGGEFIFPQGFLGDVYVQLPKRWTREADVGVGVAAVAMAVGGPMVYAQAGARFSDNYYVFTTQAVGRSMRATDLSSLPGSTVVWWQPTIAIEPIRSSDQIRYFFLTATVGHVMGRCGAVEFVFRCTRPPGSLIAIGTAMSPPLLGRR